VFTCALLAAGRAYAATIATPLVFIGNENVQCYALNVSGSSHTVTVRLITRTGAVLDQTSGAVTVPAGRASIEVSATPSSQFVYCQFVTAAPDAFRASMAVYNGGSDRLSVPAQ
jgi:hypothetical protein